MRACPVDLSRVPDLAGPRLADLARPVPAPPGGWLKGVLRVTVGLMSLSGLAWQTLPDAQALALVDMESRRAAALARPHPTDLSMVDIVDTERLVASWLASPTRAAAEQALFERAPSDLRRTARALCWLLAMWAVAMHLRTGRQPTAVVAALSYRQVWRSPEAPNTERVWDALTDRVRLGTMAALTADPATVEEFRRCLQDPPGIETVLVRHALGVMAGMVVDMRAQAIEPAEMAGTLALYTIDPDSPAVPCFRPLT